MPERFDAAALIAEVNDGDPLLTPDEAAAMLGMDPDVLEDRARARLLPSIQVGRIRRYRTSAILAAKIPPPLTPFQDDAHR